MSEVEPQGTERDAIDALSAALPRALIADGRAGALARWWVTSRAAAIAAGLPEIARHPLGPDLRDALFEIRRARRLERGLEGAESRLASEEAGLKSAAAVRGESQALRISRLLVVSGDASERFYRQVEKLRSRFENRLEVLVLECDEEELGAAAFGPGRRARAVLIHHKEAVVRFLYALEPLAGEGDGDAS